MCFIFPKNSWAFHKLSFKMQFLVLRGIMAYISKICHFFPTLGLFLFKFQGVIRVRRRVTLILAVVSGIFAICWGTNQVLYSLFHYSSYEIGPVVVAISNTMVLFNSAVNPFIYALSSQNFKEKVKGMICTCKTVVHPTGEGENNKVDTVL